MAKKIAQINIVCRGSTGRIVSEIQSYANHLGYHTHTFYGRGSGFTDLDCTKYGNTFSFLTHVLITFLFNRHGHGSYFATKRLIKELKKFDPDIIHLHNIHGYYLNYQILFSYLNNEFKGKCIWTLHDCWSFTGYCSHFTSKHCDKWKTGCHHCPAIRNSYPYGLIFDTSKSEYKKKKEILTQLPSDKLVLTTPSLWMKSLISQSYLKDYPVKVINNWVNLEVFKPQKDLSNIKKELHINEDKKIILGVSNVWEDKKGLSIFKELANRLTPEYQIVLVGLNAVQLKNIPQSIIGIERTKNIEELVSLYSSAFVLLNPSIEESFSLVTLESLACNTPVIVQNTSAVHEMVQQSSGVVLADFEMESYLNAIEKIKDLNRDKDKIRKTILSYNIEDKLNEYIKTYEGMQ